MSFLSVTSKVDQVLYACTLLLGYVHARVWFESNISLFFQIVLSLFCYALFFLIYLQSTFMSPDLETEKVCVSRDLDE